jgi:hypothetical protein
VSAEVSAPTTYKVSALLRALGVMWRSAGPALLFIVANAVVQAALTYVDAQSGLNAAFIVGFILSGAMALLLYAALTAGALYAVDGGAPVVARVRDNLGAFAPWTLVQWVLVLLAAILNPVVVLLVAAATPFLPIAAMDGQRNALAVNFRTMGQRFGRWLFTTAILLVGGGVLYLLAALNTFFVKGTPASLFFWLAIGVVAWWLLTAWTLVYRSARRTTDE